MKKSRIATEKLTVLALMSALGFLAMFFIKIPLFDFLKYEPKDIFIALTGFLYGPLSALGVSAVTALLELPVSSTGVIGLIMNFLSSAAFAGTASFIYHKKPNAAGAVLGLIGGIAAMTTSMLLWNYLISPLYMGVSRAEIVPMLTTVFLPFNLLKSTINAACTMLLYRPFINVLAQCGLSHRKTAPQSKKTTILMVSCTLVVIAVCVYIFIRLTH